MGTGSLSITSMCIVSLRVAPIHDYPLGSFGYATMGSFKYAPRLQPMGSTSVCWVAQVFA